MHPRIFFIFATILTLSACAHKALDTNLHYLQGQNIDVAMNYLGVPDDKFNAGGKHVYQWGQSAVDYNDRPVTTFGGYSTGGGLFGGVGITLGSGTAKPYTGRYAQKCTVKALIDAQNIIEKMEYNAHAGGCERFTPAMNAIERDFGVVE